MLQASSLAGHTRETNMARVRREQAQRVLGPPPQPLDVVLVLDEALFQGPEEFSEGNRGGAGALLEPERALDLRPVPGLGAHCAALDDALVVHPEVDAHHVARPLGGAAAEADPPGDAARDRGMSAPLITWGRPSASSTRSDARMYRPLGR
ncbi:hypothetical protein PAHAL_9G104800 [Panicum hallii]|uniref:Uncharacterized protein n=1 Tax=Panicum hallii TaxID=206008 RepID=A0A2T8I0X6_9POAL|nr:hypothetical protein PAHAL_9G104800 [Panicum hallii]